MTPILVACQTYTWEMLGDAWTGSVDDILDWVADAGYAGIEITNNMIREYDNRPAEFAAALAQRNLQLAAFAFSSPSGFTDPDWWERDLDGALHAAQFMQHFAQPRLAFGGAASAQHTRERLDQAIRFYNEAGRRASELGISVNVHPHSHHGSLLESAQEYQYLLDALDARYVSFGPDTGHIVRGGQDLLDCLKAHLPRITHLHLKDATAAREWVALGDGICNFPAVFARLKQAGYSGWVVAEEESADARRDGVAAIRKNRAYLHSIGY